MQVSRVAICLLAGVAACATPGQVRRVETAVAVADRDRARSDSAQRAELARIQIAQRQNIDSMTSLVRQLGDLIQRMGRDNASSFDHLQQQLYQIVTAQSTVAAGVNKLRNQVDAAVTSGPPVAASTDTARGGNVTQIPSADVLIDNAQQAMRQSAYASARRSLNQVLSSYPTAPQVPDAIYLLGFSFDSPETLDSARVYYNRVWTAYPKADKAPTALFKLGTLELKAGNRQLARKYWLQIVNDYRQSLEYENAQRLLRENP